ncbi:unnamed protein product [Dracunculus medinensis]|uniref:Uncharacterized protein n=1 Tax=Dracunculus medinensis TaxID=318479 RepID=A0A0N4UL61_DRAME|nr:unnamed protein product [Dracunculus medinensis]
MSHSVIKTKFWNARPQSHHTLKTKSIVFSRKIFFICLLKCLFFY